MILVVGSTEAREESMAELLALSLEHVTRSRLEPGCVSHAVHVDAENPRRLVFVEPWASREMLWQHFAVPASQAFAKQLRRMSAQAGTLEIYDAAAIPIPRPA
jgi:quinol monooxygenase YgiN